MRRTMGSEQEPPGGMEEMGRADCLDFVLVPSSGVGEKWRGIRTSWAGLSYQWGHQWGRRNGAVFPCRQGTICPRALSYSFHTSSPH